MKITSSCERQFVTNCIIKRQKRLDGRQLLDSRNLDIVFGKERGCCMVLQGCTRALAQVSGEVTEPKASNATEGTLHVNLEISAMAAPDAKGQLRSSDESVIAQRSLERCIRDSKCIDLESLCIVTGSKAWTIRVDIHILNDDGNLTECASIAAIAALAHFRRPDVTIVGTDVTVHSIEDREPVALNLHHMPISVNLALFDEGKYILVDPTESEERIADGCYVIGMNAHQEICFAHRHGNLILNEDAVQKCEAIAVKHAQEVTQIIRNALDDDAYKRATNAPIGFTNLIQTGTILGAKRPIAEFDMELVRKEQSTEADVVELSGDESKASEDTSYEGAITHEVGPSKSRQRAMHLLKQDPEIAVFEGGPSSWGVENDDDIQNSNDEQNSNNDERNSNNDEQNSNDEEMTDSKLNISSVKEENSADSEEETVFVNKDQIDMKPNTRGWYSKDPFA